MPHALLNIASGCGWWLTLQLQVCTYLSTRAHMHNLRCTYTRASACIHVGGEIDKWPWMPPQNPKCKRITFTVVERERILDDLDARDYENLVAKVVEEIQRGVHLERYGNRKEFVLSICSKTVKPSLVQCIMEMIARYLEICKACMRGEKYLSKSGFNISTSIWKKTVNRVSYESQYSSVQRLLQMIWTSV